MANPKATLYRLFATTSITLLAACGGGGGEQPPPPPPPPTPVADLSGRWSVTESGVSSCPGESTYSDSYEISIVQSGSNISVATPVGNFTGTLNGRSFSWSGSYDEPRGGKTTISSLTATVANDDNSFAGSSHWTWTQGTDSCSGT